MPKRQDIKTILIIGAGPIVIGQACEFDYSGTQACKTLKAEGYRVVLINSNPATIMTDSDMADATYIEPITLENLEQIIINEKVDAVLPNMGGQTALNAAMDLSRSGILEKYKVEMIGAKPEVIERAEDRQMFKDAMEKIGLESPKSVNCHNMVEAEEALKYVGLPCIIRPSFTLGGLGSGTANNTDEFYQIVSAGLSASPVSEVLVEESVLGWKEMEMEVVRDSLGTCLTVCSIENVDPMGIHTGDSITVAPAFTLTKDEYNKMEEASYNILREIGVNTGGSNVQFAINPKDGRMVVIEMNPRVSRSSALASKATGFPIAAVTAKMAVGYTLSEITNPMTGKSLADFAPCIDYVVVKVPRFTFEKFPEAKAELGTSMKSIGEVMAIGGSFNEAIGKALRSLETGLMGFDDIPVNKDKIAYQLAYNCPNRILYVAEALRAGFTIDEIYNLCKIDKWFLQRFAEVVSLEKQVKEKGLPVNADELLTLKINGLSDARIAKLAGTSEKKVRALRRKMKVLPAYKKVDTCAGKFISDKSYMYSCYAYQNCENEANISSRKKVIIFGSGPNRIGQGIEFDYCCCHAAFALKDMGIEAVMVNCNPETVSTDYDTSDRLYFEPLTIEDTLEIIRTESEKGELLGVIVQLGGQTPLKLAQTLEEEGVTVLGTSPDSIDLAEDRERFSQFLKPLNILQPENGIAMNKEQALQIAHKIGYPVLLRPSYVLGGRAMRIVVDDESLNNYIAEAVQVTGNNPVLVDRFLDDADEVDVDVICDTKQVYVAGVMQQIEEAGVHSGDSSCTLPPFSLPKSIIFQMKEQAKKIALALKVKGLMNVQFAVKDGQVYVLEVNPRASRTIPFVAKTTGVQVAKIATKVMIGAELKDFNLPNNDDLGYIAVKEVVFPFSRFAGSDIVLGPEMKSTGEVMGIAKNVGLAVTKATKATGFDVITAGEIFITVKDEDKHKIKSLCKDLTGVGFTLCATEGTAEFLEKNKIPVRRVLRVSQGRPHCVDEMISGKIKLVMITADNKATEHNDGFLIRHTALVKNIPHYTSTASMKMFLDAVIALKTEKQTVRPLQYYYKKRI